MHIEVLDYRCSSRLIAMLSILISWLLMIVFDSVYELGVYNNASTFVSSLLLVLVSHIHVMVSSKVFNQTETFFIRFYPKVYHLVLFLCRVLSLLELNCCFCS